jgi:hypothetical protein
MPHNDHKHASRSDVQLSYPENTVECTAIPVITRPELNTNDSSLKDDVVECSTFPPFLRNSS